MILNQYELYVKVVLHFISMFHVILKKGVWSFSLYYFFVLFFLTNRNENIKRPVFYMLQIRRIFSIFPQLKQLNKIKNTCEYCDFLELRSA